MSPDSMDKCIAFALIGLTMLLMYAVVAYLLRSRKREEVTPVTEEGLKQYDDIPSGAAVLMAWTEAGAYPKYHKLMQDEVRKNMPVLARALDRMVEE